MREGLYITGCGEMGRIKDGVDVMVPSFHRQKVIDAFGRELSADEWEVLWDLQYRAFIEGNGPGFPRIEGL